jgi:hypothetical protein
MEQKQSTWLEHARPADVLRQAPRYIWGACRFELPLKRPSARAQAPLRPSTKEIAGSP